MKKLNLDNRVIHDDEQLIGILTTSIGHEPSKQFVESTLDKIMVLKEKPAKVYKPLRLPLFIMLVVGLILLAPVFVTSNIQLQPLSDQGFTSENLMTNITFELDSWYILSPILLVLVLMCTLWMELGLVRFRTPHR